LCDPLARTLTNVDIRRKGLRGLQVGNTRKQVAYTLLLKGSCRGCRSGANLFDDIDPHSTRQLFDESAIDQEYLEYFSNYCSCGHIESRSPTLNEFITSYNFTIEQKFHEDLLHHVEGVEM